MRRKLICGIGAAMVLASPATAEPGPVFAASPSEEEIRAVYPAKALAAGWGGWATLGCGHDAEGLLIKCQVQGSDRHGYKGFREAGLKLIPKFRLDMTPSSKPPRTVNLTIRFVPPVERPEREPRFARSDPKWSRLRPIGPYWPEFAVRNRITGLSVIDCKVEGDGRLQDCRFIAEEPVGQDFTSAALRMSASGFLTAGPPMAGAIEPADGIWRITVEFKEPKSWD